MRGRSWPSGGSRRRHAIDLWPLARENTYFSLAILTGRRHTTDTAYGASRSLTTSRPGPPSPSCLTRQGQNHQAHGAKPSGLRHAATVGYFVVTLERGSGWDPARSRRAQDDWDAHAAFMDALAAEGFVVLGGPVGDGTLVLLVIQAEAEQEIEARLSRDPWARMDSLRIVRIEPWEVLLRGGR